MVWEGNTPACQFSAGLLTLKLWLALKCGCYMVSRPGRISDITQAPNLRERIRSFWWDSQLLCLPLRPNALLVAVAGPLCCSHPRRAPGSCATAEGRSFAGLPSCCHNAVMISGRHNPDCLNEKAISDLGFLVNAQVCEGEIMRELPPRNHHQGQAAFT